MGMIWDWESQVRGNKARAKAKEIMRACEDKHWVCTDLPRRRCRYAKWLHVLIALPDDFCYPSPTLDNHQKIHARQTNVRQSFDLTVGKKHRVCECDTWKKDWHQVQNEVHWLSALFAVCHDPRITVLYFHHYQRLTAPTSLPNTWEQWAQVWVFTVLCQKLIL